MVRKEELAKLNETLKLCEIAERYGVSVSAVSVWFKGCGLKPRAHPRVYPKTKPRFREKVRSLYESGMSMNQVAAHFGVAPATVKAALLREGGKVRPLYEAMRLARGSKHPGNEALLRMYKEEGMGVCEMADVIGVSHGTIINWLNKCPGAGR